MRYPTLLILLLFFISFSAFKIDTDMLSGVWVPMGENGTLIWSETVPKNTRCYIFKQNGKLIVRQNVGWCGTPPITYGNYSGTWKLTSDSTILLKYKYWGGQVEAKWLIHDLSEREMVYETTSFTQNANR